MKMLKRLMLGSGFLSFSFLLVSMVIPGWIVFDVDMQKMNEKMMENASDEMKAEFQQQQDLRATNPNIPQLESMLASLCPYYVHYCMDLTMEGQPNEICLTMGMHEVGSFLESLSKGDSKMPMIQGIQGQDKAAVIETAIKIYKAAPVVASLFLVQAFVSFVIAVIYFFMKHPSKKIGFVGSASQFFTGSLSALLVVAFLVVYIRITEQVAKDVGDFINCKFPYSVLFCVLSVIFTFMTAGILLHVTRKSKGQFKYEMMVIDTSKDGSGLTYVATA